MKFITQTPKQALKALLKQAPLRSEIDIFKIELITLLNHIDAKESEEFHKNLFSDFLKKSIYKDNYFINTKGRQDLVIHNGKDNKTSVGVIIEAKKPSNKVDWFTAEKPNAKALQELVLYYLRERIEANNIDIKYLVATNIHEYYIIDVVYFEKLFYKNKALVKQYEEWRDGKKVSKNTDLFYNEIAKPFIDSLTEEVPCTYFDIRDYEKILRDNNAENDNELIALFKILSPTYLLKVAEANDSNALNAQFYKELLHIIGLEEEKEGGKNIIRRKKDKRNAGSLLEQAIEALNTEGLHKVSNLNNYGESKQDQLFNIALELCITWINRILFLKLLEGQLVSYHKGDKSYCFLNSETINDFDELFKLFHKVLAVNLNERAGSIKAKYSKVPYLNSSLFEISDLEDQTTKINSLDNGELLKIFGATILKEDKKKADKLPTLAYFFKFLEAYDFGTEGKIDIREDNKPIINASVLGKVFEKINGYKDGSIFTPAFITMYMCKQSIRLAVVQKFNEKKGWKCQSFEELDDKIEDKKEANQIINSLKICDPAVGSGHFLVSALNEIIAIKSELNILADESGKSLKETFIQVIDDELLITDEDGDIVTYNYKNPKSQRIQKTLFHEKQNLIENCLFGVDINPNSVKICRLRLWIELLKNAYYTDESNFTDLETLPNIDINIKCGNSLVSKLNTDDNKNRFDNARRQLIKRILPDYKKQVSLYKSVKEREAKSVIVKKINEHRLQFDKLFNPDDKDYQAWKQKENEWISNSVSAFPDPALIEKLQEENQKLKEKYEAKTVVYQNAFEWRFEFPEVLNENGDFDGFDIVIANPPYIRQEELGDLKKYLQERYEVFITGGDIFSYFYEISFGILRKNGIFSFINNTFDKTTAGKTLREFTSSNFSFKKYIDFTSVVVFDEATTYPIILIAQKATQAVLFKYLKFSKESFNNKELLYDERAFVEVEQKTLNSSAWNFLNESEQIILSKIQKHKSVIEIYGKCYYGIKTGLNEAFVIEKDLGESLVLKPVYEGKDLKKWHAPLPTKKMIVFESKSTKKLFGENIDEVTGFKEMQTKYPQIMEHLSSFKEAAIKRFDKGVFWWELRNCAYYDLFNKPKIMFPNLQNTNKFALDNLGVYLNAPAVFLPTNDKFLLAILNSKVVWHFLKSICVIRSGGYIEVKPQYFEQIPIPQISLEAQQPFELLVEKILAKKAEGEDTKEEEDKIDQLVYDLYELSPSEVAIIEQSLKKS